jgi:cytochrome c oxidase assembly factor CtaG
MRTAGCGRLQEKRFTVPIFLAPRRSWLAAAGVVLALGVLLPPVETYARQYALAQALQFVIFAVAAPALLVLGAPRFADAASGWQGRGSRRMAALADRRARASGHAAGDAVRPLLAFIALVVVWRLPAAVNTLVADPGLTVAEMATLVAAGSVVWLELAGPPPFRHNLARPLRAAMAAVAMWTIWVIAYITGMSKPPLIPAYDQATRALSSAADQQLAVGIMWAVPAICFMPVIYGLLITWLGERDDPDQELRNAASPGSLHDGLARSPRPPRGWH